MNARRSVNRGVRQHLRGRLFGGGRGGDLRVRLTVLWLVALAGGLAAAAPSSAQTAPPSIVAQARGKSVAVYRAPGAKHPLVRLSNPTADGAPLVFLVAARRPGWEKVRLATRPDGSTGWVRDAAVTLALDPYSVSVSLHEHRVTVTRGGRVILRTPAGVGRSVLPTPIGTYYIVELLKQLDPNGPYGPYAFGLSAFSNVLYSFGGGPGQIGLHGTDYPAGIGTDVSHGCIRIGNAAISKLARVLPLGTPVSIAP